LFYIPLKILARLALKLYCRNIHHSGISLLHQPGPLLIASNHPNSFLDAIVIASHCRKKTYILVRGDVFKNKWADYFLRRLYCIPIYRLSEGRQLMDRNEITFSRCLEIFKKGRNVLIFCEGNCENEWKLRALGKGAARLAFLGWGQPEIRDRLRMVPVGLTYQNFDRVGKKMFFMTGEMLSKKMFTEESSAKALSHFNLILRERLNKLILHVPPDHHSVSRFQSLMENSAIKRKEGALRFPEIQREININVTATDDLGTALPGKSAKRRIPWWRIIGYPLSWAGWLLHAPLYYPLKSLAKKKTANSVFYDSVLFGLLFLTYPLYLILLAAVLFLLTKNDGCCLILVAAPILAFIALQYAPSKKLT
jgi:1-acyl-sn-glycerol-3-phosphate acyltransferase